MLLLQQMIVLFILMILGYFLRKTEKIGEMTCKSLSWIVVNVANPALIISGSISSERQVVGEELMKTMGIAIALFAGLILLSLLIPVILRVPKQSTGVYKVMTIFSNIGFMGFPLISALYGSESLVYASLFLIPFNLLIYTYGILAMKTKKDEKEKIDFKKALNIGVFSCIVSIIISLTHITVPDFAKTTVMNLSNLTAPLSMMVIGASMANIDLKKLFTDVRLLLFSALKLIVIPVLGLLLMKIWIQDEILLGICMVMLATPVASMSAMLAQQYDGDYELASKGVALTTILSVVTMPLVSLITGI